MANTFSALHYHLIFSTKHRQPWIVPEIEQRLWAYLGAIAQRHKITPRQIGGIDDHIHALVTAHTVVSPCQIAQYLKGDSSKWVHDTFPELADFAWQEGYGAFTVSHSSVASVSAYIRDQRRHHKSMGFQDEFLRFLRKQGIAFNEQFLWD